jgi:hypothetical protein
VDGLLFLFAQLSSVGALQVRSSVSQVRQRVQVSRVVDCTLD